MVARAHVALHLAVILIEDAVGFGVDLFLGGFGKLTGLLHLRCARLCIGGMGAIIHRIAPIRTGELALREFFALLGR